MSNNNFLRWALVLLRLAVIQTKPSCDDKQGQQGKLDATSRTAPTPRRKTKVEHNEGKQYIQSPGHGLVTHAWPVGHGARTWCVLLTPAGNGAWT